MNGMALHEIDTNRTIDDPNVVSRMRTTFDLFDLALKMQRQNLLRRHPGADEGEIDRRLAEWLRTRPGAELGDAAGPDFVISKRFAYLSGTREEAVPE